jgi:hypothetical protein
VGGEVDEAGDVRRFESALGDDGSAVGVADEHDRPVDALRALADVVRVVVDVDGRVGGRAGR